MSDPLLLKPSVSIERDGADTVARVTGNCDRRVLVLVDDGLGYFHQGWCIRDGATTEIPPELRGPLLCTHSPQQLTTQGVTHV